MNTIHLSASIPPELVGKRLDQILAILFPDYSRARLKQWTMQGHVLVNGQMLRPKDKIQRCEQIAIVATPVVQERWGAENIPLNIIYEDKQLLVINKPVGLVIHPAAGNQTGTLLNALLHHAPALAELPRVGIVHRLDRNTSGLLVIAKTLASHHHLVNQLQARTMHREYQTIVNGVMISGGTVDAPIGRHPTQRTKMAITHNGKSAITHYRIIQRFRGHTHLSVQLETGRTHQIRVHMAYINYPIVGDMTYGGRLRIPKQAKPELVNTLCNFKHQALHAYKLTLKHPATQLSLTWTAPLPQDMENLLNTLQEDLCKKNLEK